jgi:hypothetical protein
VHAEFYIASAPKTFAASRTLTLRYRNQQEKLATQKSSQRQTESEDLAFLKKDLSFLKVVGHGQ